MKDKRCFENDMMGMDMPVECPIYENPCERVCHREINHEVKHIQPINTRIINHHIYHHSYVPCFTCAVEDEICNVYDNKCC